MRSFQSGGKLRRALSKGSRSELKAGHHDSPSREGSSHPASGRSPDSRFIELAAFPTFVSGVVASSPRSQWRGRAGFSPASLLACSSARSKVPLLITLEDVECQGRKGNGL